MTKTEFIAECNRRRAEGLVLSGNTFDVRDRIKGMGGIWDGQRKAWLMPSPSSLASARQLLPSAPSTTYTQATSPSYPRRARNWRPCGYPGCSPRYCDECDGEGYRNGR